MLIRTKLQAPPLKSRMLYRKRLIHRLCTAGECPLVLISGPVGSGKTSLACQWIKQDPAGVAWYALDEEDNEPDLFFRYLLTTLVRTEPELEKTLGFMLENKRALSSENVIPNLIESLLHLPANLLLILDDFHQIKTKEIHAALARLIQYLPNRLRIVILSRSRLPAPMYAAALKKERLELSASDLKFTPQECADLFKNVIPLAFSADQIQDLNRHMEGWAAGLQLIGLSVRSKGHIFDLEYLLNQAHEKVTHYLIHEILNMQSEKIRNFVFATALLDRFTSELCAEVTGRKDAERILTRLESMNLFLIPLDGRRKWFRYHNIFSEVVRRQVSMDASDLMIKTIRKGALWFAANNYFEDAVRSVFRYNDFEFAADLMEDYLPRYIIEMDPTIGLRSILKLPFEILKQRTLLRLYQCTFLLMMMEFSDLKEILTTIESRASSALERYAGDKRRLCEDFIIFLKSILQILYAEQCADVVQFKMPSKKISPKNQLLSMGIEMLTALIFISKGELAPAEASLAKVSRLFASYEIAGKFIYLAKPQALIARHRGRLHAAETILSRALKALKQKVSSNSSKAFLLHRHLGHIFYLQNKLAKARECAAMAVRHCEYSGLLDDILAANELRLMLHLADDEKDPAAECIQQMRAYAVKFDMPQIAAGADACAAQMAVAQGNLGSAVLWSHRRDLKVDEPFSLLFAKECLTQARLHHARGEYLKAAHLLESLRKRCRKRYLLELVLQIDILRCAVFQAMNQHTKAVSLLKEALFFAETEGYIRPFVDDSRTIAPILRRLEDEGSGTPLSPHFEKVCAACDISLKPVNVSYFSEKTVPMDLTQREIEILQWMETGLQNKQIAQKAYISLSTVKSHVRSILAKLKVRNRSQAIFKAKKFGIIGRN